MYLLYILVLKIQELKAINDVKVNILVRSHLLKINRIQEENNMLRNNFFFVCASKNKEIIEAEPKANNKLKDKTK